MTTCRNYFFQIDSIIFCKLLSIWSCRNSTCIRQNLCRCFFCSRCFLFLFLRSFLSSSLCALLRNSFSGFSNISHNCINRHYISALIELSKENSCCRRFDLHGSLVCLDFHEHLTFFYFIANIFKPFNDSTFFHVHIVLWHS